MAEESDNTARVSDMDKYLSLESFEVGEGVNINMGVL